MIVSALIRSALSLPYILSTYRSSHFGRLAAESRASPDPSILKISYDLPIWHTQHLLISASCPDWWLSLGCLKTAATKMSGHFLSNTTPGMIGWLVGEGGEVADLYTRKRYKFFLSAKDKLAYWEPIHRKAKPGGLFSPISPSRGMCTPTVGGC
jgi:hypothetical protein